MEVCATEAFGLFGVLLFERFSDDVDGIDDIEYADDAGGINGIDGVGDTDGTKFCEVFEKKLEEKNKKSPHSTIIVNPANITILHFKVPFFIALTSLISHQSKTFTTYAQNERSKNRGRL